MNSLGQFAHGSFGNRHELLMKTAERPPFELVRGRGVWVEDSNGIEYLDFIQGRGINSLGHSPDVLRLCLTRQAGLLLHGGSQFHHRNTLDLAQVLIDHSCFDEVFFAGSGTEAVECAIKLARKWGKLKKDRAFDIVTVTGAYHGRTFGSMSATDKTDWHSTFAPLPHGFSKVAFNDVDALDRSVGRHTAAIIFELVQGEAGVIPATPEFVRRARQLCDMHDAMLIFDEVQTGIGRIGPLFGYERFGVEPDVVTIGKGLGGGLPISAVLVKKHASVFSIGDHGGTYNGGPLVTAAALAVLQHILAEGLLQRINETGSYLSASLAQLSACYGLGDVSGLGMLLRMGLPGPIGPKIVHYGHAVLPYTASGYWAGRGLLLNSPRPDCLRFMPALNTNRSEVDRLVDGLSSVLAVISRQDLDPW
ncbi:aminotransferase class III-fold pyridoxal phosphate-dependent enzyme [Achromobacter xylosoxidans]|uniref:aminotransferase class III-fold pyridoxal phosphate-dependent enzyme n=1 Tax=Alcaligenes xylosoxydans xylosoxydans TaxID=85698 RepID=UPI0009709BA1|nr:aminotransferase class III-fold pyridoxal phosphate-dependent enzyme [Achromobacter xylosoxidans]BEG75476.1 Acetylornithine aminotransferase [Achromobacter xylosoxidans]